jgi:hypothetical protein
MRVSAKSTPWVNQQCSPSKCWVRVLLQWEQSGDTDLLLLNEPEKGGYERNFLDPHLDAVGGIGTATDDQKGSDSRLLEQSHRSSGHLRHSVRSRSK